MVQALYVYNHNEPDTTNVGGRATGTDFWVFDFPSLQVTKEPFVGGIDTLIDLILGSGVARAKEKGFILLFEGSSSQDPIPPALSDGFELQRVRPEAGGTIYRHMSFGLEGWLCPVLNKFFPESPERLRVKIVAL